MSLSLIASPFRPNSDFYFGKLREIEILCQADDWKDLPQIQEILEILYTTEVRWGVKVFFVLQMCFSAGRYASTQVGRRLGT